MDPITAKLMSAAAGAAADPIYVDDVFSTFLYEGTGSTAQTINNGIDLSGEGGMVWIKDRDANNSHAIYDTERGVQKLLKANEDHAEDSSSSGTTDLYQFNNNGFAIGSDNSAYLNTNNNSHCSWTFRKCPGFFDIVTYTGNGSNRTISHNLGSVPGSIWIKQRSGSNKWSVYHRASFSNPSHYELHLNETEAIADESSVFNDTEPTSTVFTVGTSSGVNANGATYVAYIFAHDDQSFGEGGNEAIIKCGSYTGDGTTSNNVNVGFEPQWLLIKKSTNSGDWMIFDNMRGIVDGGQDEILLANSSLQESQISFNTIKLTATGFIVEESTTNNASFTTYIYIAIRRPHKPPSAGTDVFAVDSRGSTGDGDEPTYRSGFPVDMQFNRNVAYAGGNMSISARLTQGKQMHTNLTGSESTNSTMMFDYMNGVQTDTGTSSNQYAWMFKRAPGFFDVVTYTGDGQSNRQISHNLGAVPQLILVKQRDATRSWAVYSAATGTGKFLKLDGNDAAITQSGVFDTAPTSSIFTVETNTYVNVSGGDYIAYLFGNVDGISKVGSYTGTGSARNLDFGFTAGARFFLYKRTDDSQNWVLFDTGRGITAGTDYGIPLNEVDAQFSGDYVDPYNAGISLTGSVANNSGATFIYLAIA